MKVVPALLSERFEDFLSMLRQAESFTDYVQIDLMDGVFVPARSFPPEKINDFSTSLSFELHVMARNPSDFVSRIHNQGLRKILFHFESDARHIDFINDIKEKGLSAGLAISPETGIEELRDIAEQVDTLLFLTVDPCCYGNPFIPEVLKKVAEARKIFPDKVISADGGVSLDNLKSFYDIGVDYVCVGSRIFLKGDPRENYRSFVERIKEFNNK